ncbi:MAG: peptidoglycan DD-metalloendopeptidase family protein [Bacteroidales bacterium]|nr:peptidoglycan DD-metalloendopeptidase family protein [Bacteroidales bacterium]
MRCIALIIVVICLNVPGITGQTRGELEKRREKTLQDIEYVDNLLKETTQERSKGLNRLNIINKRLRLREDVISGIKGEIELLETRQELNTLAVDLMSADLEILINEYEKAILHAQIVSKGQPELAYIFTAKDLNQGYKRMKYLQQVAKYRRREAELIYEIKSEIDRKRIQLEEDLKEISNLEKREEKQKQSLQNEQQKRRRLINSLGRKQRELRKELQKKQKIANAIEKEIERIIEEESRRRKTTDLTPEEKIVGDDFSKNKRNLPWPVARGIITSHFGVHNHPIFKGTKVDNIGIEITSGQKESARVVFNGTVVSVFGITGGNMAIIVRHGRYLTVYQNIVNVIIKPGDEVITKQKIGDIFYDKENGSKCIIKFMVFEEKKKLDPELWIVKRR